MNCKSIPYLVSVNTNRNSKYATKAKIGDLDDSIFIDE
jgi:hypothetical protein